jgi:hypothetical protein
LLPGFGSIRFLVRVDPGSCSPLFFFDSALAHGVPSTRGFSGLASARLTPPLLPCFRFASFLVEARVARASGLRSVLRFSVARSPFPAGCGGIWIVSRSSMPGQCLYLPAQFFPPPINSPSRSVWILTLDPSPTVVIGVDLPLAFSSLKLGARAWDFVLQLHPVEPSKTFSRLFFLGIKVTSTDSMSSVPDLHLL